MKCKIYSYGTLLHLCQIYTGFSLLAKQGQISLTQTLKQYAHKGIPLLAHLPPHATYGLICRLDDDKLLFYDVSDKSTLSAEALDIVDVYFKRSYIADQIPLEYKNKVFPLGLNYEVYAGMPDRYELQRFLLRRAVLERFPIELVRCIAQLCSVSFLPTDSAMQAMPALDQEPRVLLMVRAWDPNSDPPGLPEQEKEDRMRINDLRATCIRRLREELGSLFYGGFIQTDYAMKTYGALTLDDSAISGKKNYLTALKKYPICIATAGLHGSIGWKMGEYIAFAKAIVSERLSCEVPAGFQSGANYLEFETAEGCLQKTVNLIENKQLRHTIMQNNRSYYETHLRPDKLVLRTLNIAQTLIARNA